ncbi:MAG: hypothetical protein SOH81_10930 [Acetobacter sp.]|jgi:hypothetical protein
MPLPDSMTTSSMSTPTLRTCYDMRRGQAFRCGGIVCTFLLAAAAFGLLWHDRQTGDILRRIHHGLVICTEGRVLPGASGAVIAPDAPTQAPVSLIGHPDMVHLNLVSTSGGDIVVWPGSVMLQDALKAARANSNLVMLSLHDVAPEAVVMLVLKYGMRHSVVLQADANSDLENVFRAASKIMVAVPAETISEVHHVIQLAGRHPLALLLPLKADADVFEEAHRNSDAVIVRASMDNASGMQWDTVLKQPVDIIMTNHSDRLDEADRD